MKFKIERYDHTSSVYLTYNQELLAWITNSDYILYVTAYSVRHPLTLAYSNSKFNRKLVNYKQNWLTMRVFTSLVLL